MKLWITTVLSMVLFACADGANPRDTYSDLPAEAEVTLIDTSSSLAAWEESGLPHVDAKSSTKMWKIVVSPEFYLKHTGVKSCFDQTRIANNETKCSYAFSRVDYNVPHMFYVRAQENYSWAPSEEETTAHEAMHVFSYHGTGDADMNHKNERVWKSTMELLFPRD